MLTKTSQKQCSTCNDLKSINSFRKNSYSKDGLRSKCKDCDSKTNEKYRLEKADIIKNSKEKYKHKEIKTKAIYRKNNKEKLRNDLHIRRLKEGAVSDGTVTSKSIAEKYEIQQGKCVYCLTKLEKNFHRDHIIPISKGGGHTIANIQLLCPKCNMKKGSKLPEDFKLIA